MKQSECRLLWQSRIEAFQTSGESSVAAWCEKQGAYSFVVFELYRYRVFLRSFMMVGCCLDNHHKGFVCGKFIEYKVVFVTIKYFYTKRMKFAKRFVLFIQYVYGVFVSCKINLIN